MACCSLVSFGFSLVINSAVSFPPDLRMSANTISNHNHSNTRPHATPHPNPSPLPCQPQIHTSHGRATPTRRNTRNVHPWHSHIGIYRYIAQTETTPTKRHPISKEKQTTIEAEMLLARASPSFLPSTSSSPTPSSQALPPSASFGRSQRTGGALTAASPNCTVRRPVMAAAVPAAKLEDAEALIDSVETFIFDCDGERLTDRSRFSYQIAAAFPE